MGVKEVVTGDRIAEWLSRLVRIPSVTPVQAGPRAGVPGEARIAAQVAGWFREFGGEVALEEVFPERPNVYGIWRGRSERWAAVDVHLDTVGVEQMLGDPFSGRIDGGSVHGRGAVDTKATLSVVLALLEAMHQAGRLPEPNLLIAATSDEEGTACGAPVLADWVRRQPFTLDQLAVAEPTECAPAYGHKGVVRISFEIQGVSAHSSQPHLGKNAISAAARLVEAIGEEARRQQEIPRNSALGAPALSVTEIAGGRGISVIPDRCRLSIDRRVVDGEIATEVRQALLDLARQHCPLPFTVDERLPRNAFLQPPDSPWIRGLSEWSGRKPTVVPYCTNAWAYGGLAQECVVIGPGSIDQAHGNEEWVAIAELEQLSEIFLRWWGLEA
jgi:acetylornithine deacetylase/succinyl-diaminopimelate desuccinylase-like protein